MGELFLFKCFLEHSKSHGAGFDLPSDEVRSCNNEQMEEEGGGGNVPSHNQQKLSDVRGSADLLTVRLSHSEKD